MQQEKNDTYLVTNNWWNLRYLNTLWVLYLVLSIVCRLGRMLYTCSMEK